MKRKPMIGILLVCFLGIISIKPSTATNSLTPSPTMTPVPILIPVTPPFTPPVALPPGSTLSPTRMVLTLAPTRTLTPTRTPKDIILCENATPLSPGQSLNGTTIHPKPPNSADANIFATGGLWYKIIGTGGPLKVDTCNFANFPTTVEVYMGGTCGSIKFLSTTVNGNCGGEFGKSQDWFTTKGTTYYVLVYGLGKKGSFEITLSEQIIPLNDLCINASPILSGQVINGSTTDASADNVPPCGIDTIFTNSLGVWYTFQSSSQPSRIVANTCLSGNVDTAISVFTGTCDKLMCVAGNDNYCNYYASRVEWESETATDYLILVHGANYFASNFSLQLEEVPATPTVSPAPSLLVPFIPPGTDPSLATPPQSSPVPLTSSMPLTSSSTPAPVAPPLPMPPPVGPPITPPSHLTGNQKCDGAILIALGQSFNGSTYHANGIDTYHDCSGNTINGGVWYKFIGTGGRLKVDTCDFADYGSTLSVFIGSSCDALQCVGGGFGLRSAGARVPFDSVMGATYYILVQRAEFDNGYFTLTLSDDVPVVNDQCVNALPIGEGETISGRTNDATPDDVPICDGDPSNNSTPGVWYHFRSSGEPTRIVANTCVGFVDDFIPGIAVYKGSCGKLECVAGNSNFCRSGSRAAWESNEAADYYILVFGMHSFACGNNFKLELTVVPATPTASPVPSISLNLGVAIYISMIPTPLPPYSLSPVSPAMTTTPSYLLASTGAPSPGATRESAAPYADTTTITGNPTPTEVLSMQPLGPASYTTPSQTVATVPRGENGKGYFTKTDEAKGKKGDKKDEKKGGKGKDRK